MDAVEEHQVTRDFLPGGCDAGEFSLVNAMKGSTECYDVAFGDDLMCDQFIAREGCLSLEDVFLQAGSLTYWLIRSSVFGWAVIALT